MYDYGLSIVSNVVFIVNIYHILIFQFVIFFVFVFYRNYYLLGVLKLFICIRKKKSIIKLKKKIIVRINCSHIRIIIRICHTDHIRYTPKNLNTKTKILHFVVQLQKVFVWLLNHLNLLFVVRVYYLY